MSRSRQPRANHSQDADEERRLWGQIKADAKKIDVLINKSATIGQDIVEIERLQAALVDADKPSDAASDDKLEQLYRENIRINETIQHMLEGESGDTNILDAIRILSALRESADDSAPLSAGPRSASTNGAAKSRTTSAMARRKGTAMSVSTADDAAADDSASVASPRVAGGRLSAVPGRDKSNRGSSAAPSMREASVKIEDGAESVASSNDGVAHSSKPASEAGASTSGVTLQVHPNLAGNGSLLQTPTTPTSAALQAANRLNLVSGAEVFYRNKGRAQEGEGILCRVTSVIGEGKQRRYEIQDADPDPAGGEPPSPYRASVSHLVAIPTSNTGLPDLPKGRNVLAQYPDTTTFYKAEVSTHWRAKDLAGDKGAYVRLRFEGEMEEAKETEVERRLVVIDVK